jgi:hypothetical protein
VEQKLASVGLHVKKHYLRLEWHIMIEFNYNIARIA